MSHPSRTRVLVAGLGDTGVLVAGALARRRDLAVTGVTTRPGLVSGQELGLRLARPEAWARDYRIEHERLRRLDRVRVVHARLTGADLENGTVTGRDATGAERRLAWDLLVVATGVGNGFWRTGELLTPAQVDDDLAARHARLAVARSVLVVGGGAAGVGSALQIALRWPATTVALAFPGERALPQHAERTWCGVRARLEAAGVELLAGHRAVVPAETDNLGPGVVHWHGDRTPREADAVLWTIGRVRPHTDWLPPEVLDDAGFVRVAPTLQVPGRPRVFAVGDVAATDELRTSARNRADRLLARNVGAWLDGRDPATYRPRSRRWGSVLGPEPDGLRVYSPAGRSYRFPAWSVERLLQPLVVRRGIYGGVRDAHGPGVRASADRVGDDA
ncbi:FAD-dependent oxidoreductase [Nocardioides sp.]|uniref:FAD-dependent oxidoreductase n=1 Tax=Nocardioides sp. TaxID=35761 RepID=UPI00351665FD